MGGGWGCCFAFNDVDGLAPFSHYARVAHVTERERDEVEEQQQRQQDKWADSSTPDLYIDILAFNLSSH